MTKKEREGRREKYKPIYDMFIALYPFTTENLDGEIWLPIPDFEELYHCSNFGRVKSFKNGKVKILKPLLSGNGYLYVQLRKNGKEKNFRLNILVAKLFIPNSADKPEVNHRFSRFSNHVDCLEWSTSSENQIHAFATGLAPQGEDRPDAKLTNKQVLYIRENPDGLNLGQLAEKFPVNVATISQIQLGKTYKNVGGTVREKFVQPVNRTPDDKRAQIIARYNAGGISQRALAREFSVSRTAIRNIIHGR